MAKKLTGKQKRFGDEYLIDLNATRAYIDAGYSVKSKNAAAVEGHKLLKNPKIQAYIQKRMKDREGRTEITQDRVLKEYAKIGFFNPKKLFRDDGSPKDINEIDDDTAAAIAGLEVMEIWEGSGDNRHFVGYLKKYKIADKKGTLDSLGRHLGLFNDKLIHSGNVGVDNPFKALTTDELKKLIKSET